MTASSIGLVALVRREKTLALRVYRPDTLEEQLSLPIAAEPTHLLGSWRSSSLVAIDLQNLSIVDLATKKLVQRIPTKDLGTVPPDVAKNTRPGTFMAAALARDGRHLYILCRESLRRHALTDSGLAPLSAEGYYRAPTGTGPYGGGRLLVDADGHFAFSASHIFDLRAAPPRPILKCRNLPLALDLTGSRVLAFSPGSRLRPNPSYCLLDRRGVPTTSWPIGKEASRSPIQMAWNHPDGKHYLLWCSTGAWWVELDPSDGAK